jgi:hypothetical protein
MEFLLQRCGLVMSGKSVDRATGISGNLDVDGTTDRVKEISRTSFVIA